MFYFYERFSEFHPTMQSLEEYYTTLFDMQVKFNTQTGT
jgi:hypothetical protein